MKLPFLVALLLSCAACGPHYRYTFRVMDPGVVPVTPYGDVVEDADLKAELWVFDLPPIDNPVQRSIKLTLTNKTDDVMQVRWPQVLLVDPSGTSHAMHPEKDVGWLEPGASKQVWLIPFPLPERGDAALANDGKIFELQLPLTVRKQPKQYGFHFLAHVAKAD